MVNLVYTPTGVDPEKDPGKVKRWPWEPRRLSNSDAIEIERVTGLRFGEWQAEMDPREPLSMRAMTGFLYVMLKKDSPYLRVGQVEFCADEIGYEVTEQDRRDAYERLKAADPADLSPAEVEYRDALRVEFDPPGDDEGDGDQGDQHNDGGHDPN